MTGLNLLWPLMHRVRVATDDPHKRMQLKGRVLAKVWERRFASFGPSSTMMRPAWLNGTDKIEIGDRCLIHAGAWLSVEPQAWGTDGPALVIGDDTVLGHQVFISASERIVIGKGVILAAGCRLVDGDHEWSAGNPMIWMNPCRTAPIHVGDYSWLADGAKLLRGASLGRFCIVGASAVVKDEFPDFSIVVGSPARVVGSSLDHMSHELRARVEAGEV